MRTLTKCQSLNSLLALYKLHTQVNIFSFTFLDLLIKMMKIRLLYILYCPPTPNMWLQGSFNPWPSYHQSSLPSPPHPHRMSAKIGVGCCNHIAFWAWNLNLNSKSNKIWKNEKGMAFLRNILFCRSDVSLQRYETSKFEENAFFTKSAAVHNFYIANSPWNLYLNSKSHKIWKNEKGNGVSKEYFILSVRRFVAKIWLRK